MALLSFFFGRQVVSRAAAVDIVEESDLVSASATLAIAASVSIVEADDQVSATATVAIAASVEIAEDADTVAAEANTTGEISAAVTIAEQDDSVAASAAVEIRAALNTLATFGADHSSIVTVAGHSLSVSTASLQSARSTLGRSTGSLFMEFTVTSAGGGQARVGIGTIAALVTSPVGNNTQSWAYRSNNGEKITNSGSTSYGETWTAGDVIGALIEFSESGIGTLTFYKNGNSQGVAYNNIPAGTYYVMASPGISGGILTFNFGDSAFSFTQPAGSDLWQTVWTEDDDTVSATAAVAIAASVGVTEDSDAVSATATIAIAASVSITEDPDSVSATAAAALAELFASLTIQEDDDLVSAAGYHNLSASISIIEDGDIVIATAGVVAETVTGPGFIDGALTSRGSTTTALSGRGSITTSLGPTRS